MKSVQRGELSTTLNPSETRQISIAKVDPTKAFLIIYEENKDENYIVSLSDNGDFVKVTHTTGGYNKIHIVWQVVEFY